MKLKPTVLTLVGVISQSSSSTALSELFEVVSEEGWEAANKHVLRKMLTSEEETSVPGQQNKTQLSFDNYDFRIAGTEDIDDRPAYLLDVLPKRRDKYLFRGRIWIDAEDFALVRAEGQPAKNPSFWTRSIRFTQRCSTQGQFWFATRTQSVTEALLFGQTDVTISYFGYAVKSDGVLSPAVDRARVPIYALNHFLSAVRQSRCQPFCPEFRQLSKSRPF